MGKEPLHLTRNHGMFLVYYNKAMDLTSLSINVNEKLVSFAGNEQKRIIDKINSDLVQIETKTNQYTNLAFLRGQIGVFSRDSNDESIQLKKIGLLLTLPIEIDGNKFLLEFFSKNDDEIDYRRIIPSIENVHSISSELKDVALVRGITFFQQEIILQYHMKRYLQYLEIDYLKGKWRKEKQGGEDENAIGEKEENDMLLFEVRPDYMEYAIVSIPYTLDVDENKIEFDIDKATFNMVPIEGYDEEEIIEFYKEIIPPPVIPRLINDTFEKLRESWDVILLNSSNEWELKLLDIFFDDLCNAFPDSINVKDGIASINKLIIQEINEIQAQLDSLLVDLDEKILNDVSVINDDEKFNNLMENIKENNEKSDLVLKFVELVALTRSIIKENAIAPIMLNDPKVSKDLISSMKKSTKRIASTLSSFMIKSLMKLVIKESITIINDVLKLKLLTSERGVVKDIGSRILEKFHENFTRSYLSSITDLKEQDQDVPFIEIEALSENLKKIMHESIMEFQINTTELIKFARDLLDEEEQDSIITHVQKFITLERDVTFLKNFILKSEIFNSFLEKHADHFYDPKSFSKQFLDFINKKIDELPLDWTILAENWLNAFSNIFQIQYAQSHFDRIEIINKFFDFLTIVSEEQCQFDNIFPVISSYIGILNESREKNILLEFLKRFEQSKEVQSQLPAYFENKILDLIDGTDFNSILKIDIKSENFKNKLRETCLNEMINPFEKNLLIPNELGFMKSDVETNLEFSIDNGTLVAKIKTSWFKKMGV
ncbi:MAG: hypothetical protein ACTSVI_03365 [Promethearchaeota archaeon]